MDGQRRLWKAVASARRALTYEQLYIAIQNGLLYAVLSITLVYTISRFFVLPYYSEMAFILGGIAFVVRLILALVKRPKQRESLLLLDQFYPHNELVTVLTTKELQPLLDTLRVQAERQIDQVLAAFHKRPKQLLQKKALAYALGTCILFLLLLVFPAATQQEAKNIEADRSITKAIKKETKQQLEKPVPEQAKKQLAELQKALEEAKTSDEALKELVKTQKELAKLKQDLLAESLDQQPTAKGELTALQEVNKTLAESASNAQSKMSTLGKPIDLTTQKVIASMNQQSSITGANQSTNSSTIAGQSNNATSSQSNGTTSSTSSTSTNANQNSQSQSGQGQSGQGQGQGQGGQGKGGGQGSGSLGGLLGGSGSGGRDLIAVPQRVGEANEQTIDGGIQNEGERIKEKGTVPATKGEVRPYADVLGTYEESFRQSTERLQLPNDLQQMVQQYFTSIEK
jgi:hypothetical protein